MRKNLSKDDKKMDKGKLLLATQEQDNHIKTELATLSEAIYLELKKLAHHYLAKERVNHTLLSTELVHEVYLRMVNQHFIEVEDRSHFLGVAARLMRQILVDYARSKSALKRQGEWIKITFDKALDVAKEQNYDLLDLEVALCKLEQLNPLHGQVVEFMFFGGLSSQEIANLLQLSERTVQRYWKFARAWLYNELKNKNIE